MVTDFLDDEAEHSGEDMLVDSDNEMSGDEENSNFINDSEEEDDGTSHMKLDSIRNAEEAENDVFLASQTERHLTTIMEATSSAPEAESSMPVAPVTVPNRPLLPPKVVTSMYKPVGPQTVFMPDKPSQNAIRGVTPTLTLAFPVWMGAYSSGSLADVEMAQAVQYVLNAATIVQQKDGAQIKVSHLTVTSRYCLVFLMFNISPGHALVPWAIDVPQGNVVQRGVALQCESEQVRGRDFLPGHGCHQEIGRLYQRFQVASSPR